MADATATLFTIPPPTEIDDTHKIYSVAAGIAVIGIIASLIVSLRLGYRFWKKNFGLDDYAIIVSLVMFIGWSILGVYAILAAGIGKPLNEVTLAEYTIWFQCLIAITFIYPWMSTAIRVSIILFYWKIFAKGSGHWLRWSLWALLTLQGIYAIVFTFVPLPMCSPFYYAWVPTQRPTHCSLIYWYYVQEAQYASSLALDGMLLFFPILPVAQLQMPLRKRLGVGVIFVLGAVASVATAIKLAIWVQSWTQTLPAGIPNWFQYQMAMIVPPQFDHEDITVFIPSQIEPALGLIGASLPALWPMVRSGSKLLYGRFSQMSGKGSKNVSTGGNTSSASGIHVSYNVARHVRVGSSGWKQVDDRAANAEPHFQKDPSIELQTRIEALGPRGQQVLYR